jgi:hypothetical protein
MKIQWHENISFSGTVSTGNFAFNPTMLEAADEFTFACFTNGKALDGVKSGKNFTLAGEYEMADILMKGFEHKVDNEIIYKITAEGITCVCFGSLKTIPESKVLKELGENVDVLIVNVTEEFGPKKTKELIEKIEPRYAVVGGDPIYFAELKALIKITLSEERTLTIPKASAMDEGTEVVILAVK